jgi:hypothetical protein
MSQFLLKKVGYLNTAAQEVSADTALASPAVLERLNKFAKSAQVLAPKSDDFLYFTIIFLKAAEASLIDEKGDLKKLAGGERAWGYFDDKYSWYGNVKPHRNNNGDIFPEGELKKAARDWIGMPLCVDHKSESVDGIRGIILDTYYDEKHKQVVGLCALDKVTYPNLARKVQTGVVRYGSMGTAVSTSICSDCGKRASTQAEYCQHVISRTAYGEINIGLKPMEYSLVVQPAEPGARLLQCIAKLRTHQQELFNHGITDFEKFSSNINLEQAEELGGLLKTACGPNGCSIEKRSMLINSYISSNGLNKVAQDSLTQESRKEVQFAKALSQLREAGAREEDVASLYNSFGKDYEQDMSTAQGEVFTSGQSAEGRASIETFDSEGVRGTGGESTGLISSDNGELVDSFDTGGVGPESYAYAGSNKNKTYKSVMEDIMKESKLAKRAELRRRLAYYYGGASGEGSAEPVEPATFKPEDYKKYWMDDKHMHQDKPMGGQDGMFPGDKEIKEQQKRAKLAERRLKRLAYFYGGASGEGSAEPVEPATFKSEDYKKYWMDDKHMHQDKSMGGDSGTFPGDMEIKQKLKRAKLSTKFKQVRALNGVINKSASAFEVYADGKLILATTAKDIYGPKLETNWKFLNSQDYGKAVVSAIRTEGLRSVASKLAKTAQGLEGLEGELPPVDDAPMDAAPMDEAPMDLEIPEDSDLEEMEGDDPQARVDEALVSMESAISDIRGAIEELGGRGGDVEINVEQGDPADAEKISVSKRLLYDLKNVLAESSESADELALISEAFESKRRLPSRKLAELRGLVSDALNDSAQLSGESRTLLRMASVLSKHPVKVAEYVESAEDEGEDFPTDDFNLADDAAYVAEKEVSDSKESELYSKALSMRKRRRLSILASARKKVAQDLAEEADEDEAQSNEADDGAGHSQRVAEGEPKGGQVQAVPGDKAPTGSSPRMVAEKSPTGNMADDGFVNYVDDEECEEIAEEEVEEHEEDMHQKNDANDVVPNDGVQNAAFVTEQQPSGKQASSKLNSRFVQKKAADEREIVKLRIRRAYDLAMDMQRKGLIAPTRAAIDSQVDLVLDFDDRAFEAFKTSIANARMPETIKIASDLGGVNIGYEHPEPQTETKTRAEKLSALFS